MMKYFLLLMNLKMKNLFLMVIPQTLDLKVCVISLSSVIKKYWIHCPILKLQKCLYESFS